MTALTESKSVLKTKIVKSGQFADKGWNRIQIIQEKIKNDFTAAIAPISHCLAIPHIYLQAPHA